MQLPVRFGKYELQEFLGGGMSHVYRALDTVIGRQVAVKILTGDAARDVEAKERFLHEARISGTIQHDHIVTIHDYGEEEGFPYIVMEFLRGGDLRDAIRNGQAGDLLNRLRIAAETASALEFCHQRGIIHRDIKPENIFLEQSGRSKIMDFGISKAAGFNLTKAGNTMGTPYYMSPEQVMGVNITPQVDVYSYGIVLYELFTGERLVSGDSMERLFYVILNENPDPLKLQSAGAPKALADLVVKCAAKKPEERFQGFGAVRQALASVITEVRDGVAPRPGPSGAANTTTKKPAPAIKLGPIMAAGLCALLLGGAGLWFLLNKDKVKPGPTPPGNTGPAPTLAAKGGNMNLVPAGEFLFGSSRSPVKLPAFYMDVTEVGNRAYREFATASGHALPDAFAADAPSLPVTNVSFTDAKEFCTWAGKRLPDEREWEKAARGADGRNYPWGNDGRSAMANVSAKGPAPVDSFETGASPYKLLHMTGNVWEWIDHPHTPSAQAIESFGKMLTPKPTANEPWHYIKGGAYDRTLAEGVVYEWSSVPGRFTSPTIGFRCAQDLPESK
ncbi:MAG: protein kinase [Acidobacteria bacterium]|nr:protein kinase [Acidobacteriota bacterium]